MKYDLQYGQSPEFVALHPLIASIPTAVVTDYRLRSFYTTLPCIHLGKTFAQDVKELSSPQRWFRIARKSTFNVVELYYYLDL